MPARFSCLASYLVASFCGEILSPSLAANLTALTTGFYSVGNFLGFRLGLLRNAVPFGVASENFLEGIESGFVLVALLWHALSMPRIAFRCIDDFSNTLIPHYQRRSDCD